MPSKSKNSPAEGLVHPRLVLVIRLLVAAAIGFACYLLWVALTGSSVAGCGPDSACDKVLHSRWSRWLSLPVSALALLVYAAVFAGTFWLRPTVERRQQRRAWSVLIPCAVVLIGAAVWFLVVQSFILKSFCPFCLTAHGCGLAAAVMLLYSAPFRPLPEKAWQQEKQVFVPPTLRRKLVLIALAGVALLVAGQFVGSPGKQFQVATLEGKVEKIMSSNILITATQAAPSMAASPTQNVPRLDVAPVANKDVVSIYDGKIQISLREVPVIGPAQAPYSIVSLFDYTCHHCRIMHAHLMEAHRKFQDQLAIVSLPMPLCEKCNHTIKRSPRAHAEACDYARIGLAVWRANRNAQAKFDDWMFGPASPPSLAEARQYASQISGFIGFEAALKDPWIDQQIQRDVSIYETNYLRGLGSMPQLLIGTNLTSGNFGRVEDLYKLLADNFGLKADAQ